MWGYPEISRNQEQNRWCSVGPENLQRKLWTVLPPLKVSAVAIAVPTIGGIFAILVSYYDGSRTLKYISGRWWELNRTESTTRETSQPLMPLEQPLVALLFGTAVLIAFTVFDLVDFCAHFVVAMSALELIHGHHTVHMAESKLSMEYRCSLFFRPQPGCCSYCHQFCNCWRTLHTNSNWNGRSTCTGWTTGCTTTRTTSDSTYYQHPECRTPCTACQGQSNVKLSVVRVFIVIWWVKSEYVNLVFNCTIFWLAM